MTRLAEEHMETRFLKIDAERSPFLVERLRLGRSMRGGVCACSLFAADCCSRVSPHTALPRRRGSVWMIPTILCFIDNKKVDAIEGLDDLGGYARPGSDSVGWFCLFGVVGLLLWWCVCSRSP